MIRFFCRAGGAPDLATPALPADHALRIWRPDTDGYPPAGSHVAENVAWLVFARMGLFSTRDLAEQTIWQGQHMLHRLIVTPRWYRFPFMAPHDLQIGAVWTAPGARGLGLSRGAIAEAHRRHPACARFWYVTDDDNEASVRLATTCGYVPAGTGFRTRPLGLSALGRFHINSQTPPLAAKAFWSRPRGA